MAGIFRGQGCSIAKTLAPLPAFLFAVIASPTALAQLYEQPVLVVDSGMHTAPIMAVAVDAEGQLAVTGSRDKTVRVWSPADGKLLQTIRVPAGPGDIGKIYAVAMSPDGELVASGGSTRATSDVQHLIYLFETRTGKLSAQIAGVSASAQFLIFSLDGRYLAAGLTRGGLRVYDRNRQWSEVFRDTDYADDIFGVTFAGDGRLATASWDGKLRLYDPDRGSKLVVPARKASGGGRPHRSHSAPTAACWRSAT